MVMRQRAAVEEYLARCDEPPYSEYVDGAIIDKAMPDWFHALIVKKLTILFAAYEANFGGVSGPEIRVEFDTGRVPEYRLPDYAYWAPGLETRRGRFGAPPTLAVEVRSPDEPLPSQRAKCRYFRRNGVAVAWLIDPTSRTVEIFDESSDGARRSGDAALEATALPGFRTTVASLFALLGD